jgi:hypothetical protein
MSDNNNIFDPEKIAIIEFKMLKGQVDTPEDFDTTKVNGHHLDNAMQLGFNLAEKLVKVDFTIEIKTESKRLNSKESIGDFHFVFTYHIENLEKLAKLDHNNLVELNPGLANALSSVTYSTSRGILLTRLQGTALQNFMLPVINPNKLLHNKKDL